MKTKTIRDFISAILLTVLMLFSGVVAVNATETLFEPANFVLIRGGEFTMGSPEGEVGKKEIKKFWQNKGIEYSETPHQVWVNNFSMSRYAVTVAEFRRFVKASGYQTDAEKDGFSVIVFNGDVKKGNGVNWRCGVSGSKRPLSEENHPVLYVSWNDAVAYCKWLSTKTGKRFRLPTEAEREYACRAGSRTPFNTGENLTTEQANYNGKFPYNDNPKGDYRENTVPVNSFSPNAWGLYNMHGNVWEWCSDWFGGTYYDECKANGTVSNPAGSPTGSLCVIRGGSWDYFAEYCRSAARFNFTPAYRLNNIGFRLVLVP